MAIGHNGKEHPNGSGSSLIMTDVSMLVHFFDYPSKFMTDVSPFFDYPSKLSKFEGPTHTQS